MEEMALADIEEFALVGDAADVVRELARGVGALRDEVHVFLHALDLGEFFYVRGADGVVEAADVIEQFRAGCFRDGSTDDSIRRGRGCAAIH